MESEVGIIEKNQALFFLRKTVSKTVSAHGVKLKHACH